MKHIKENMEVQTEPEITQPVTETEPDEKNDFGAVEIIELIVDVTKRDLENYRSNMDEIRELRYKLEHAKEVATGNDVVFDYRSGYPKPQTVVGIDETQLWKMQSKYQKSIDRLVSRCDMVEDFIESITDGRTRRIFRMLYADGVSLTEISKRVHMDRRNVRKLIDKFLKENSIN